MASCSQAVPGADEHKFVTPKKVQPRRSRAPRPTPLTEGRFAKNIVIPPSPFLERLGYGTGVSVYKWDRSPLPGGTARSPWAVKKLNSWFRNRGCAQRNCLLQEAAILKKLDHPNIVGFRGFAMGAGRKEDEGGENPVLLMEKGDSSLMDLIDERNGGGQEFTIFPAKQILKVGECLASALDYLHNTVHFIHGDLKSANVLIKGDFEQVKLCDFGVAIALNEKGEAVNRHDYVGTYYWSPKEALDPEGVITHKSDIYPYGLIIWEMLTLQLPHCPPMEEEDEEEDGNNDEPSNAEENELVGTQPALPEELLEVYESDDLYEEAIALYFVCTEEDPDKRPSAAQIVDAFKNETLSCLGDTSMTDASDSMME